MLRESGRDEGGSELCAIQAVVEEGGDWLLQEQLDDGSWTYRCDELTLLWALGNFRCAVIQAAAGGKDGFAEVRFCLAIHARPDVVFELVEREGLSPTARRSFEAARARCYLEEGWHSEWVPQPVVRPSGASLAR